MRRKRQEHFLRREIRPIVFGVEDSLISTLGAVTGIAGGLGSSRSVLLAGIVLILVEALSMAAGEMISTQSEQRVDGYMDAVRAYLNGLSMGISYILAGLIPILPYAFWDTSTALPISIIATFIGVFLLGIWKESLVYKTRRSLIWSGLELTLISASIALVGYVVGAVVGTII